MGKLTARLLRALRAWDSPTQIALMLALALLGITLLVALFAAPDMRQPALIGAGGLLIVTQIIVMWGNRNMVTPYTQAQRAFLEGDFETSRHLLEVVRASGKADVRDLTLLGNTYRQLGNLEASEDSLTEALRLRSNHHFPLYGFGRTLLIQGRYAEAVDAITHALEAGAPPVIKVDLGDAYFRQELWDEAWSALEGVRPLVVEPHRALMVDYLLYRLGKGDAPAPDLIESGLPYWRAEAERFRQTPYGQALAADVRHVQTLGGGRTDV
jgi:tetratricopeptide (TPR) repeat protein